MFFVFFFPGSHISVDGPVVSLNVTMSIIIGINKNTQ